MQPNSRQLRSGMVWRVILLASVCLASLLAAVPPPVLWKKDESAVVEKYMPYPPAKHPRLYLRAAQAAQLPERLKHPILQPAIQRLQAQARQSPQMRVEWEALQYLISRDPKAGRTIIESTLPLLQKCELADRGDACRETGRMMVTGAIVYDWCYGLLTAEEKQRFVKELVRLAKTQECGYPPTGQGSITGHSSEAMIMRDMISAGIAIYDEFPEMYRLAAGRFFRKHRPARKWLYQGHAYHQGDSYGLHRYSWDTYPLWIFDRLGAGNVYSPEQRYVPYHSIYVTRPDGQRLRGGDTFAHSTPRGRPWSEYMGTLLTGSYYGDGVLEDQFRRHGSASGNETIFEVLWRNVDLQPTPVSTLPLSRYFGSPYGWMVARTGWGNDAVIAEMKINEYNFANHQHLDAGAFQIYFKGTLASDSGLYYGSSGLYGSPHNLNYYWRTIAHNSLLIYDPAEDFGRKGYGNDGGQRLPNGRSEPRTLADLLAPQKGYRTGKVLAHGFGPDAHTPDYTLLQGDITEAYSKKVQSVTRSFVFLNLHHTNVPAALVVLDRVVSAQADFRKFWLLHTLEEPRVDGASATVDVTQHGGSGRLNLDVLLPAASNADLSKVGGPGKEYWVFGTNYANAPNTNLVARGSVETSHWRLELSPKTAAAEDHFLAVMQITDHTHAARWPVRHLDLGERLGCQIEAPDCRWLVIMRKTAGRSADAVPFTVTGPAPARVLIMDLAEGRWQARRADGGAARQIQVEATAGAAWLTVAAGAWTLDKL